MTAHFQSLMDTILKSRRPFTVPHVSPSATPDELNIAAHAVNRLVEEFHNNLREVAVTLYGTTPFPIKIADYLADVSSGGADIVSDIQGAANRIIDLREYGR